MSTPTETPWARVYNDVKMQIPGVVDVVLRQMTLQVIDDFFDRTNIWTEEVPIVVDPSTTVYPFTLAKKGTPNRLMLLYDPAMANPDKKWVQGGVQMDVPGVITLRYAPSSMTTWNAVIAKSRNQPDSEGYPDMDPSDQWIIQKYSDGIHYGVLSRLQASPGKPYSNPKLGAQNWQIYVVERGKARTDALKSNVFGGQRWMFPQSFAVGTRKGWA